jgi:hypothetical protein
MTLKVIQGHIRTPLYQKSFQHIRLWTDFDENLY